MSIKDTYKHLKDLLANITVDLEKSENGNKAASQRVRTGTVKMEKLAKLFRKESISTEKKTKGQKRPPKSAAKKSASHSAGKGAKAAKAKSSMKSKGVSVKAKPKAKATHARTNVRPRQFFAKRATAKLPTRRVGAR